MARFLSGFEVEEVYATGSCLVDPAIGEAGDVDTAVVTLRFAGGAVGVVENSRRAVYGYDQRAEVFGSAGTVRADNELPNRVVATGADGSHQDPPLWFFLERYREAYRLEVRSFVDALGAGTAVPVSGEDGIAAHTIAIAATRSLRERRPVRTAGIEEET
jgi:myo-inositol 2-dehydrogenase/D-chiro-inositol 1-dehydrogenase